MSRTRELPCPHCLAPLRLERRDFFPTRRRQFHCPECQGVALLPLGPVLAGVVAMLLAMAIALGFAKPLLERGSMETVMDFVVGGAVFLGIVLGTTWLSAWVCRTQVNRLEPWPRKPRP